MAEETGGQQAEASGDAQQANLQYGVQVNVFATAHDEADESLHLRNQLVRAVRLAADDPQYAMREKKPLSSVYVRQSVGAPADDPRRRREEEAQEAQDAERFRRLSGLSQPFDEVIDLYDHLVLDGVAGVGKTTLGNHLVRTYAESLLAEPGPSSGDALVPLMLPARELAARLRQGNWPGALRATVTYLYGQSLNVDVPAELFTRTVHGMRWLIVIDALDEIPDEADRSRLLTALATRVANRNDPARYVITTRPLSRDEISRLKSARVGFYELQPFDEDALELFARKWFASEGTDDDRIAHEFLEQVRAAGLQDVVTVPLLARVAAEVFASRQDRSLPASRFHLYEEYIRMYADVRASPGGRQLFAWLDEHRAEVLESLATAYTTREAPLLDVLEQMLLASDLGQLPHDWKEPVSDWLTHTGVVGRAGSHLRFLHQTFAEHLAAAATARRLPAVFVPEQPPWDDVIRRLLLDDEQEQYVLLHYLHQQTTDTGLLDWLQQGSQDHRERAAALLAQGARYTPEQLGRHLAFVEQKALADHRLALQSLAALTHERVVREFLERLCDHSHTGREIKISSIDLLGNRERLVRDERAPFLVECSDTTRPPDLRRQAAEVLAKLDGRHRDLAVEVLTGLARGSVAAAESLAKLGEEQRELAAQALIVLTDAHTEIFERMRAAEALAKLGGTYRGRAAATYRSVAEDPVAYLPGRCNAVEELAKLGGEHRRTALVILRSLVNERADVENKVQALSTAAWVDPEFRDEAMRQIYTITCDSAVRFYDRKRAAKQLAKLGAEYRMHRAKLLAGVVEMPFADHFDLVTAVPELLELGPEWHIRAAEVLREAMSAPEHPYVNGVCHAAKKLAKLDGECRREAGRALEKLCHSPSVTMSERREAAHALANLGPNHHQHVVRFFGKILGDPRTAPREAVEAVRLLGDLDPLGRISLVPVLNRIADAATTDADTRHTTGKILIAWGPDWVRRGLELLVQTFEDPTAPDSERYDAAWDAAAFENAQPAVARVLLEIATDPTDALSYRDLALSGYVTRVGLPPHEKAAALKKIVDTATLHPGHRIDAARQMAELVPELADEAVLAAVDVAADLSPGGDLRLNAAERLATWPGQQRHASRALRELTADRSCDPQTRRRAANGLSNLGSEQRSAAAQALEELAADPTTSSFASAMAHAAIEAVTGKTDERVDAALQVAAQDPLTGPRTLRLLGEELARRGPQSREVAVPIFLGLIAERAGSGFRRSCVDSVVQLGLEQRQCALTALRGIIADRTYHDVERCDAAYALAKSDARNATEGATALAAIAGDKHCTPTTRLGAARNLRSLGADAHRRAAQEFHRMAATETSDPWHRLWAARELTTMGVDSRSDAATALHDLRQQVSEPLIRAHAVAVLATIEDQYHTDAVLELLDLADASQAPAWQRQSAATALALLSRHHHDRAADRLARLATDEQLTAWERRQAAEALAQYGSGSRARAVRVLTALLDTDGAAPWERVEIAQTIGQLDPDQYDLARETLHDIAAEATTSEAERHRAAEGLRRLRGTAGTLAAEILNEMAETSNADLYERRRAAVELAELGPDNYTRACALLTDIATDARTPELDQALARADLGSLDHRHLAEAHDALEQIARDTSAPPADRRVAAEALVRICRSDRTVAMETLKGIITQTGADSTEHALAHVALAVLDATYRDQAEAATRRLLNARSGVTHDDRRRLARDRARLGHPHAHEAALALREIIIDRAADPATRFHAARDLTAIQGDTDRVTSLEPNAADDD